jgi:hypothetical protein
MSNLNNNVINNQLFNNNFINSKTNEPINFIISGPKNYNQDTFRLVGMADSGRNFTDYRDSDMALARISQETNFNINMINTAIRTRPIVPLNYQLSYTTRNYSL